MFNSEMEESNHVSRTLVSPIQFMFLKSDIFPRYFPFSKISEFFGGDSFQGT